MQLDKLVTDLYPLDRYKQAIRHAAEAGSLGAIKVAFDLRGENAKSQLCRFRFRGSIEKAQQA